MFTGIVEEVGAITAVAAMGDSSRFTVRGPLVTSDAGHGDSIAVNGVCLTVVDLTGPGGGDTVGAQGAAGADSFTADVMHETLSRSSLGDLRVGSPVNLERAAAVSSRLGGHIVQGHVDAVGTVISRTPHEHWEVVRVAVPASSARYVVEKGSITVDGVSLTVSALGADEAGQDWFEVSLIPTTLASTVLGDAAAGTRVNLEVDVIAKYVERLLGAGAAAPGPQGLPS
ncbi:riboflavin synthase [Tomitella gaofuii]|uniref:riboflavin synthase n=1 Tax=Tomitella gaofuii TaxID=2760083 RepID=UPI0015FCC3E5|nr:riboflavin synthase [Tomitella gaofuii]